MSETNKRKSPAIKSLFTLSNTNFKLLIIGALDKNFKIELPFNIVFFDKINNQDNLIEEKRSQVHSKYKWDLSAKSFKEIT